MNQVALSPAQIELACEAMSKYVRICSDNEKDINSETIINSSLLRRLLGGKHPLPEPPPLRFGMPAYELVENEEVQVDCVKDDNSGIIVDSHEGYRWLDKEKNVLEYPRLGLAFKICEREVIPNPDCVNDGIDPDQFKYTGIFLKRLAR